MEKTVQAVRFHSWGDPEDVLVVEDVELSRPGPGQVLVRMKAAPINPADINLVEGKYGFRTELPSFCGNEGAGVVSELGRGVSGLQLGQWVRPVPGVGCWREALVVQAKDLLLLPSQLTTEQAATISVNAATAWRLLHDFAELRPGDWVAQNAATSAVGRAVIQICRHLGVHSLNLVRRQDAIAELEGLGADVVIMEGEHPKRHLPARTRLMLGLNAVGGESATRLIGSLGSRGTLVTYGAMAKKPLVLGSGRLIFKELSFHGFWVTGWYRRATAIAQRYGIQQVRQAVAHSRRPGRGGKVLLEF